MGKQAHCQNRFPPLQMPHVCSALHFLFILNQGEEGGLRLARRKSPHVSAEILVVSCKLSYPPVEPANLAPTKWEAPKITSKQAHARFSILWACDVRNHATLTFLLVPETALIGMCRILYPSMHHIATLSVVTKS